MAAQLAQHETKRRRHDSKRFQWSAIPLLAPSALLLLVLFLLPVAYSFYLGLTNLQLIGPHSVNYFFTGFWNIHLLLNDPNFWRSVWLTFVFVVGSGAIGSSVVGLTLALCMQRANPALRSVVGAIVVLGTVLPPATVAVVWSAVTSAGGILSLILGFGKSDFIFTMPMLVVSLANGWSLCGLSMLMFGAALRNVPKDMIEAAMLENAGPVRRFTRIVFPVIRPTVLTSCLLMTLLSFGNFTVIFLMTGGGPAGATNILPLYSYLEAFTFHRLAYGALLGNVIVLLAAFLGIAFVTLGKISSRSDSGSGRRNQGRGQVKEQPTELKVA